MKDRQNLVFECSMYFEVKLTISASSKPSLTSHKNVVCTVKFSQIMCKKCTETTEENLLADIEAKRV